MKLSQLPVGALVKDPDTKYNNDVIIWQVLEHGHSGDPLGSTTLQSRDILTLKALDAKEPNNSNSNRKNYGNNRYKYSNILQWLNADKNNWYEAQHSADQEPSASYLDSSYNPYSSEAGFLTNFSDKFKKELLTTSKTTALESIDGGGSEIVSSKLFLLSTTEVGFPNVNSVAEGSLYSLYNTTSYRVKNLLNTAAKGDWSTASSPWRWTLRTIDYGYPYQTKRVSEDGSENTNMAFSCKNGGITPALCISSNIEVSDTPDASNVYTLKFAPQATKVYVGDSNGLAKQIWPEPFNGVLFDNGESYVPFESYGTNFANGYSTYTTKQSLTLTQPGNALNINQSIGSNSTGMYGTAEKVDITNFNTLHILFQTVSHSGLNGGFAVNDTKDANINRFNMDGWDKSMTQKDLDISNITGENYICIFIFSANGGSINNNVYKIWLE